MVRKVGVREWHDMALRGETLPLRFRVNGVSMAPLIRRRRDFVTIMPLSGPPEVGDVVLFCDPERPRRYVLHRLWELEGGRALTWGDNCDRPDGRIPVSALWGRAVLIERGKKKIRPDAKKGMRHARAWHPVGRLLRRCRRAASRAYHALRRAAGIERGRGGVRG